MTSNRMHSNGSSLSLSGALILAVALAFIAWYSYSAPALNSPDVISDSASAEDFSAERARVYLYELTRKPRPVGSAGHRLALEYIVESLTELGLQPEVQSTTSLQRFSNSIGSASVKNILAYIPT